jgi:hypothetical protein
MKGYLELHYISPHTKHKFDKTLDYILVLVTVEKATNNVKMSKLYIKNIGNVNEEIRAFSLNHSVPITEMSFFTMMLFQLDKKSTVTLLFSGLIDLDNHEYNGVQYIALNEPPSANGVNRHAIFTGDDTFLSEQFYHYDHPRSTESFCILFFAKTTRTRFSLVPTVNIPVVSNSMLGVYDRYNQVVLKELTPGINQQGPLYDVHYKHLYNFIQKYCIPKAYINYLNDYQIDSSIYEKSSGNPFARHISLDLRPIRTDPYLNNILVSPSDARIRAFNINESTKFILYNKTYKLIDFMTKPQELKGGSGYLCRMNPQDYQRVYTPYAGYLSEIGIYDTGVRSIILKYESDFFMPPTVHERDYAAVIYGNFIYTGTGVGAGNRAYPELLDIQPDTRLVYYVILMGSIELSNARLKDILKLLPTNTTHRIKPVWIEKGEELGYFGCSDGTILMMTNRPIEFATDISYYSKMKLNSLNKPIDTYIKARDIVGLLQ